MVRFLLILVTFISFGVFSQDSSAVYSVYFDVKTNPGTKKLLQFESKFYQKYSLVARNELDMRVAAGNDLIVDETGIYIEKNRLLSISRTEIRENSAYHLNNGYLHGVLPNDSVLVALDGELYYFLIPTKTYLFKVGSTAESLYQGRSANEYLIFSPEEKGQISVIMVTFSNQEITLSSIDLEQKEFDFKSVTGKQIKSSEIPLYILSPTPKEWSEIMLHFIKYDVYKLLI